MHKALFVSDIHITGADDPKYAAFLKLLNFCLETQSPNLFLVGDIFDLWIADRPFFTKRYALVIEKLRALVAAGTRVHYFEGNHDLDLHAFWAREVGVLVYDGPTYFGLGAYTVRVEHGDEMDPDDRGYLFLRWLLRTPVVRWLGRHLPGRVVGAIGERASRTSRDYTSTIKTVSGAAAIEKMRAHGERAWRERAFDVLVCGHTHRQVDLTLSGGARLINLGTWLVDPTVLCLGETFVREKIEV